MVAEERTCECNSALVLLCLALGITLSPKVISLRWLSIAQSRRHRFPSILLAEALELSPKRPCPPSLIRFDRYVCASARPSYLVAISLKPGPMILFVMP
jgi:hypothetical protein